MHAPDLNKEKNRTTEVTRPACSYSVETLMALQKILENGLPDAPAPLPRPATRSHSAEKPFQPVFRPQSEEITLRAERDWKTKIHHWLMKLRKAKQADKGHSAQQTG